MGTGTGKEAFLQKKAEKEIFAASQKVQEQRKENSLRGSGEAKEKSEQVKERLTGRMTEKELDMSTASRAFGAVPEEEIKELKGRMSYQNMSTTAEQRKRLLKDSRSMTQVQREAYQKEYEQWKNQEKDPVWETQANQFKLLFQELAGDEDSASEAFQAVKDHVLQYFMVMQQPISDTDQYRETFLGAKAAVEKYANKHQRIHFTGKGRRRRRLAERLLEQLKAMEVLEKIRLVSQKAMENEDFLTNESKLEEAESLKDEFLKEETWSYRREDFERNLEEGNAKEKVKAFFRIAKYLSTAGIYEEDTKKRGVAFKKEEMEELESRLSESLQQLSPLEQMEISQMMFQIKQGLLQKEHLAYEQYKKEAPAGEDPSVYAKVKLRNSTLFIEHSAFYKIINSLIGSDIVLDYISLTENIIYGEQRNKEKNEIHDLLEAGDIREYEDKLSLEALKQIDISEKYREIDKLLGSGIYFDERTRQDITEQKQNELVNRLKEKEADKLKERFWRENVPQIEPIPEDESQEARKERRELQTKKMQEIAGHDSYDFVSYNLYVNYWKRYVLFNNSMEATGWTEKVQAYNRKYEQKTGKMENRIYTVFMKGYMVNEKNEPMTEEDKKNKEADQKFVDDYTSHDLERRKPYLDKYINALMNMNVTREMLEPDYVEKNCDKIIYIGQVCLLYENILKWDKINEAYFKSLPETVQKRVDAVMKQMLNISALIAMKQEAWGIEQSAEPGSLRRKEKLAGMRAMVPQLYKMCEQDGNFEKLQELVKVPMTVENEVKAQKLKEGNAGA